MSKFKTKVKSIRTLNGNICEVVLHLERPDKRTGELTEVNRWVYVGIQNEWLGKEGDAEKGALPPGDPTLEGVVALENNHFLMCNVAAKKFILNERYKKWLM